jgi:nucleoside-diphosphate-sugar epimerase
MPSLLIAGASGLVGNATLERALSRNGWTDVVGLSRRRPEVDTIRPYRHSPSTSVTRTRPRPACRTSAASPTWRTRRCTRSLG